jgi:hypothetical protein
MPSMCEIGQTHTTGGKGPLKFQLEAPLKAILVTGRGGLY